MIPRAGPSTLRSVTKPAVAPPPGAKTSTVAYRVPFYDTDAMRIVHHANYVRYFELARVELLSLHDMPYTEYIAQGLHFVVTSLEVEFHRAARFGDRLEITCWLEWVKGVSLRIRYRIECEGETAVTGSTTHALVSADGKPVRIPEERRKRLASLVAPS